MSLMSTDRDFITVIPANVTRVLSHFVFVLERRGANIEPGGDGSSKRGGTGKKTTGSAGDVTELDGLWRVVTQSGVSK